MPAILTALVQILTRRYMKYISLIALGLTVILVAVISVLTLTPIPAPQGLGWSDKTYHLFAFMALTIPIATLRPKWLIFAILAFAMFGGAIEIIQPFVGRSRDFADWIFDLYGVVIGGVIGLLLNSLFRK